MTTTFSLQSERSVGTLTMRSDPDRKPPTLDQTSLNGLDAALAEAERRVATGELRVLFLVSASDRFFCAGANIEALGTLDPTTIPSWIARGHQVFARLEDLPVPTVARIEGYALGGGLELALACDLIFAANTAQFGQTEARLGFVAGWGGSWRLPRRVGIPRAKELLFSARHIPATEAFALGLVDYVGDRAELAGRCEQFAADVLAGSAEAHRQHKRMLAQAADRARAADAEVTASMDCIRNPNTRERIEAFLTGRK